MGFLLSQTNIRVDACTYAGFTPLRLASSRGCQQVVERLIAEGADQSQLALDDYDSSESDDDSVSGNFFFCFLTCALAFHQLCVVTLIVLRLKRLKFYLKQ